MSKKGEWMTGTGPIQITQMDDQYLRNSLRFCYRKVGRQETPVPGLPAPPVTNTWRSRTSSSYYEDKFVELGEEAQRRNWIPQTITYEQLITIVADWEAEAVRSKEAWMRRQAQNSAPRPPPLPMTRMPVHQHTARTTLDQIASAPPATIGIYVDVCAQMHGTIRERLPKQKKAKPEKLERNISFEL